MSQLDTAQRNASNQIRLGTVAEVDLAKALCRVQSGEILTDWLHWLVGYAGQRVEWSAPSVGEQVVVLSIDGEFTGGVVLRGLYSTAFPAPGNAEGKHLQQFGDGAVIEYDSNAHALKATLPGGGTAEISADGGTTVNGPVTINGKLTVNDDVASTGTVTATTDVVGGGKSLKGHKHTGVQAGGGVSGPPQ